MTASRSATALANVIVADPATLVSTSFIDLPPNGTPTGLTDPATSSFFGSRILPAVGGSMAVFSTGDALVVNTDSLSPDAGGTEPSYNDGGTNTTAHGSNVYDVTELELDLEAPTYADCVGVNLDYMTNDLFTSIDFGVSFWETEYVDGVIAQLDPTSAWTVSSSYPSLDNSPPAGDFAVDALGYMLDSDWLAEPGTGGYPWLNDQGFASDTPYNAASGWTFWSTPVTPGAHTIDLSLFDRGDANDDSTVLINGLTFFHATSGCGGLGADEPATASVTLNAPSNQSTTTAAEPTIGGTFETLPEDLPEVTVRLYAGTSASGSPLETLNATDGDGTWSATPTQPLPLGTYTVQAEQQDLAGNTGLSSANTFAVVAAPASPTPKPAATLPTFLGSSAISTTLATTKQGSVTLPLTCSSTAVQTCDDDVAIYGSAGTLPSAATEAKELGSGDFTIASGASATEQLKLSAAGRKLIKSHSKLPARLLITASDGANRSFTWEASVKLKRTAPKHHAVRAFPSLWPF